MKKFLKALVWVVVAVIFAGTFVYLFKNSQTKKDTYASVVPTRATIEKSTVLTGKIEPRDEIDIKPQISGIITRIDVEAGDRVTAGDVIAHIKVIPEASQLSSAQSHVNLAEIELGDARVKYQRDSTLYAKKVIARQDYETSLKTYERACEELASARDAYRIVREGVSQYNAGESNTLVRATITGLVLDVPVKVGSSVIQSNTFNDGTTIATVADMNNLIFKGNVDETEVGLLRLGMPMEITIGALPEQTPVAVVEYIAPKGTNTSGANTFEIKAALTLDNADAVRAGYSANAKVSLAKAENVLTLPEGVVEYTGDSTFVYLMTDSLPEPKYLRTAVQTGMTDGLKVEIKSGIDSTAVVRGDKTTQK